MPKRARSSRARAPAAKRRRRAPAPARAGWHRPPALTVARKFFTSTWQFGSANTNDFWRYFIHKPSDMPNWAEYAAVFDEYRLNAVKVTFHPRYDSVDASAATAIPQAHIIVDPGSTMIPSGTYTSGNLNAMLENSGVRTRTLTKPTSVYYKPKMAMQVFGGATNVEQVTPKFLKTNDTSVDYRGFHMFIQANNFEVPTNVKLDTFVTFYLTFRNTR